MHNSQKALMIVGLCFGALTCIGQNAEWNKFVSKTRPLSFQYPAGWNVQEGETRIVVSQPATDEELLVLALPSDRNQTPEQLGRSVLAATRLNDPNWGCTLRQSNRDNASFDFTYTEGRTKHSAIVIFVKGNQGALWFSYDAPSTRYDRGRGERFVERLITTYGKDTEPPAATAQNNTGQPPSAPVTQQTGAGSPLFPTTDNPGAANRTGQPALSAADVASLFAQSPQPPKSTSTDRRADTAEEGSTVATDNETVATTRPQPFPDAPADVQTILDKLAKGQVPTPAEMDRMKEWSAAKRAAVPASAPSSPAATLPPPRAVDSPRNTPTTTADSSSRPPTSIANTKPSASVTRTATSLQPSAGATTGARLSAPSEKEYLSLLKNIQAFYATKVTAARGQLDAIIKTPGSSRPADQGVLFAAGGCGSASIYLISSALIQKPDDVLAINNLGVALNSVKDFSRGIPLLLYADRLRPQSSLIRLNLGWAHYNMGDFKNARPYFAAVAAADTNAPAALLGLGLVAAQEGDSTAAIKQLRMALMQTPSEVGVQALKTLVKASSDKGGGEASSYHPTPSRPPGNQTLQLPGIPASLSIQAMAAFGPVLLAEQRQVIGERMKQLTQRLSECLEKRGQKKSQRAMSHSGTIVYYKSYKTEEFMLDDMFWMLLTGDVASSAWPTQQKQQSEWVKISQEEVRLITEKARVPPKERCAKFKERATQLAQAQYQCAWITYSDFKTHADDYVAFTDPVLARVYDPVENEIFHIIRELRIIDRYGLSIVLVGLASKTAEFPAECEKLAAIPVTDRGELNVPRTEPKCPFDRPVEVTLPVPVVEAANFEFDCEKVKLELGEGILTSLERNIEKKETTFGVGVGGMIPGVNFGGKTMVEITIGPNWEIVDVGYKSSVEGTTVGGGYNVAGVKGECESGYSLRDGPFEHCGTKWSVDVTGPLGAH